MKIQDILHVKGSHVHAISPGRTLLDAVGMLMEHRIGALLVRDGAGPVAGIITERDLLRECQRRAAELGRVRVDEAMTRDIVVCRPDDDAAHAMALVTKNRVRHLPVVDGEQVVGMISIGDLVKACLDEAEYENRCLKEYLHGR
jgi:CBS domain-containing protein